MRAAELSDTSIMKLNVPEAVGVPDSTPPADRVRPVGNVPLALKA